MRAISPYPNYEGRLRRRAITYIGNYYKAKVTRGPDRGLHTLQYKCACQRWDEEIEAYNRVDWTVVEPSDDEFEDYLEHPKLKKVIANLPSDNED